AGNFNEGMAPVKQNGKWGFINNKGKVVIPFQYDVTSLNSFNNGLVKVKINEYYGFINKQGEEVIPFIYENVDDFSEGLAGFLKEGKYGFMDLTGKEIIKPIYKYTWGFNNGLAAVEVENEKKENKWGFINKKGILVIPTLYSSILPQQNKHTHKIIFGFYKNKAYVSLSDKNNFYINNKGLKISD
ncbi:MAG: WG repeat-containing protein, partial [Chitinophagaceae bacterium]|nr:WG repeat-containing protein [Chitinophagaceae bacterium]